MTLPGRRGAYKNERNWSTNSIKQNILSETAAPIMSSRRSVIINLLRNAAGYVRNGSTSAVKNDERNPHRVDGRLNPCLITGVNQGTDQIIQVIQTGNKVIKKFPHCLNLKAPAIVKAFEFFNRLPARVIRLHPFGLLGL